MNEDRLRLLTYIAALVVLYFVLKKFGVFKSSEERKADELVSASAFDPKYYRQLAKSVAPKKVMLARIRPDILERLYKADGWIYNTPETLIAIIKGFKNKAQVSQLSEAFFNTYNLDLSGHIKKIASPEQAAFIYDYVNSLPSGVI